MAHDFGKFVLTLCLALSTAGCMSVVDTPDDLVLLELHAPQKRESPGWMHIVIGSKFDFQKYSFENENQVMPESYFCDKKEYDASLDYPTIYTSEDGRAMLSESPKKSIMTNGYYRYDVFINSYRKSGYYKGFGKRSNEIDEIDFATAPQDVCLNFHSFGGFLVTLSNVVRIPKERLAEEMAHPTPGGKHFDPMRGGIIK